MPDPKTPRELIIKGVTRDGGETFRPSDWAERLCGVLAMYRPGYVATRGPGFRLLALMRNRRWSPACAASIVDARLHDLEPRAWDFVMSFASDNDLATMDAAGLVEAPTLPAVPPAAG